MKPLFNHEAVYWGQSCAAADLAVGREQSFYVLALGMNGARAVCDINYGGGRLLLWLLPQSGLWA